jgi:predicted phosphodiesterase
VTPVPDAARRAPRRIAFISDVHGDAVALRKVIADLEAVEAVDEVLLGGDLAQGGAQPSEVVDEIRRRGWLSVRGNAEDLLIRLADGVPVQDALQYGAAQHGRVPKSLGERALRSVALLGYERIEYLRSLPMSIERGPYPFGSIALVHATPWSTEDVVLPDAEAEVAAHMLDAANARLLVYGHIHTPYQRRLGDRVLMSIGAVSGSNDRDPRPAYSIVELGATIEVEVRRVEWPPAERLADYRAAGVPKSLVRDKGGPFPVRSAPFTPVTLWP